MFYRRKILLALIEAFGGNLKRTDCQKLLFLFCQRTQQNHYDFFPYHFGSFSFIAAQDQKRLADLGFLHPTEDFKIKTRKSFLEQITTTDRVSLLAMANDLKGLRGKPLIYKAYSDYPLYTCRSKIVSEVLSKEELKRTMVWWNNDTTPCLFTIGYEGLTIDAFLNKLIVNNILALVDVRKNPISMKYGFSKSLLRNYVEKAGIKYFHEPDLGVPSNLRVDLNSPTAYKKLFAYYEKSILPKQPDSLQAVKSILDEHLRIALTCFEHDHLFCHRHKITERLSSESTFTTKVIHL